MFYGSTICTFPNASDILHKSLQIDSGNYFAYKFKFGVCVSISVQSSQMPLNRAKNQLMKLKAWNQYYYW